MSYSLVTRTDVPVFKNMVHEFNNTSPYSAEAKNLHCPIFLHYVVLKYEDNFLYIAIRVIII
jgi:hypothetical protein